MDDLDTAGERIKIANGKALTGREHVDAQMASGMHANVEMKFAGPDGVVVDISQTGWEGTD